jgi:hypothetical protein
MEEPKFADALLDAVTEKLRALDCPARHWQSGLEKAVAGVLREFPDLRRGVRKASDLVLPLVDRWGRLELEDPVLWPFIIDRSEDATECAGDRLFSEWGLVPENPETYRNCSRSLAERVVRTALWERHTPKGARAFRILSGGGPALWGELPRRAPGSSEPLCWTVLMLFLQESMRQTDGRYSPVTPDQVLESLEWAGRDLYLTPLRYEDNRPESFAVRWIANLAGLEEGMASDLAILTAGAGMADTPVDYWLVPNITRDWFTAARTSCKVRMGVWERFLAPGTFGKTVPHEWLHRSDITLGDLAASALVRRLRLPRDLKPFLGAMARILSKPETWRLPYLPLPTSGYYTEQPRTTSCPLAALPADILSRSAELTCSHLSEEDRQTRIQVIRGMIDAWGGLPGWKPAMEWILRGGPNRVPGLKNGFARELSAAWETARLKLAVQPGESGEDPSPCL